MVDLLGQLEASYKTRKGYWKGGTVGVFGYGGGVIPRFTELKNADGTPQFKDAAEFHTIRIMPPAGMHYDTATLREFCNIWEKHGSGLIAMHGQSGDVMFQGCTTENVQKAFDELNEMGFDLGGAGPAVRTSMSCVGAARCEQSCYDDPDLFAARPLIVNGRYTHAAGEPSACAATPAAGYVTRTIDVDLPDSKPRHDVLASLWARTGIDGLMAQDWQGLQRGTMRPDLRDAITHSASITG